MSAPRTNIETQKRRHRPALIGFAAIVAVVAILAAIYTINLVVRGNTPGDDDATPVAPTAGIPAPPGAPAPLVDPSPDVTPQPDPTDATR
jgi:hypothetical protein